MECLVLWLLETVSILSAIPFLTFLTSNVSMAWESTPRDAMSMSNNRDNYTPKGKRENYWVSTFYSILFFRKLPSVFKQ